MKMHMTSRVNFHDETTKSRRHLLTHIGSSKIEKLLYDCNAKSGRGSNLYEAFTLK